MRICDKCHAGGKVSPAKEVCEIGVQSFDLCAEHAQEALQLICEAPKTEQPRRRQRKTKQAA